MSQQYLFDETNHTFSNVELWWKPESQYVKGQQSGTSKYGNLQAILLCFLPFWDLPGCILKIGEALGEIIVNPPCFYTDHRGRGHKQGLGLPEKLPVPRNKSVLTRMIGVVALSTQQCIAPNVLLECDGNVGKEGFYMCFFCISYHKASSISLSRLQHQTSHYLKNYWMNFWDQNWLSLRIMRTVFPNIL